MVFETYSQRLRRAERQSGPDVYTYDQMPSFMRQQIVAALKEAIGNSYSSGPANNLWREIAHICSKEIEGFSNYETTSDSDHRVTSRLLSTADILVFLDVLEISCRIISSKATNETIKQRSAKITAQDAIDEINLRFQQNDIGYQINNGLMIRVDSEYAHREIIKPILKILKETHYRKASEDFSRAHQHLRVGAYKDAVTAANRAFESTLKAICDTEGWTYQSGDNAGQLVSLVSTSGLFTHAFDKSFNSFVAMMKTGLPSLRNDAGAHGESIEANAVTPEIARYAINMTAANILFLAECHEALRKSK